MIKNKMYTISKEEQVMLIKESRKQMYHWLNYKEIWKHCRTINKIDYLCQDIHAFKKEVLKCQENLLFKNSSEEC